MGTIALIVFHVQHLHGKLQWPDPSPFKIDSCSRQHVPIEPISGRKCSDTANMASRRASGPAVRWESTVPRG
jgi:hypothetical protein